MALPRFNSGGFGRLTYTVLNEAFGLIEANRAKPGEGRGEDRGRAAVVNQARWLARITDRTATSPVKYSGVEVARSADAFGVVVNGRTMDKTGDVPANIYGINRWEGGGAAPIPNGTVVEVHEYYTDAGALARDILGGGSAPQTAMAFIDAWITIPGKVNQYSYGWKEVERVAGAWVEKVGGLTGGPNAIGQGKAFNGAEASNNGTGHESYGVDVTSSATAVVTLNPIGWGLTKPVVVLTKITSNANPTLNEWLFTAGNNVGVECAAAIGRPQGGGR